MEHGGKMEHLVFKKNKAGVGLFLRPLDFCNRPVQRHTSKSNLQQTTFWVSHEISAFW